MRILVNNNWKEGFLDYYRSPKEFRIKVLAFKNLEKLENVYHTRRKSLKLILNYLPIVGPGGLFWKTWSRLREEWRNEKYISCGFGEIIEGPEGFSKNEVIGFIAPLHPALVERITLPEKLIFKIDKSDLPEFKKGKILYHPINGRSNSNRWWDKIKGWSICSGIKITNEVKTELFNKFKGEVKNTNWNKSRVIDIQNPTPVSEVKKEKEIKKTKSNVKKAILFGYGNYAKINIIPYSQPFVRVRAIHEIDPTQIFFEKGIQKWDTAPFPRKGEKYDVYFVASYNHTHIPITLHALNQGAYVVVEKPVAMDYQELSELEKTLKKVGPRLFIGFQKRYGRFNRMAFKDLGVEYGEPISYHSIVYELEQPELFWYNWPVSRSTFFANGCHQIDHFLYLNNFSRPINYDIMLLKDNSVLVWMELENGATFTTVFSEKGSLRVGPRDIVELKVPGRNVRIVDNIEYLSEDDYHIIRKDRRFKTESYKEMYKTIAKKIANNENGDSIESTVISTKLMLDLEEKLQELKGWGNRYEMAKKEFWSYFKDSLIT